MTDEPTSPGAFDDDESPPVAELAALGVEPSPQFLTRVRGRLERRLLTSHLLDLSVAGTLHVAVELTGLIVGLVQRPGRPQDR